MQGYGYVAVRGDDVREIERFREEKETLAMLRKNSEAGEILFHHRFPTSTPNVLEATHPIYVSNDRLKFDYFVAHNGVISNPTERRIAHEKLGYEYTTVVETHLVGKLSSYLLKEQFNDSEALAIDLAEAIENKSEKIESYGSIAFIVMQVDKETGKRVALYCGRNYSSPLCFEVTNHCAILSSVSTEKDIEPYKLWQYNYETHALDFVRPFEALAYRGAPMANYNSDFWRKKDELDKERGKTNTCGFNTEIVKKEFDGVTAKKTGGFPSEEDVEDWQDMMSADAYRAVASGFVNGKHKFFYSLDELDKDYTDLQDEAADWEAWLIEAKKTNDTLTITECEATLTSLRKTIKDYDVIYKVVYGADTLKALTAPKEALKEPLI